MPRMVPAVGPRAVCLDEEHRADHRRRCRGDEYAGTLRGAGDSRGGRPRQRDPDRGHEPSEHMDPGDNGPEHKSRLVER